MSKELFNLDTVFNQVTSSSYKKLTNQFSRNATILTTPFEENLLQPGKSLDVSEVEPINYLQIGKYCQHLKRFEEALKNYDQAISADPSVVEAYVNRGIILINIQRFEEALENYDQLIAIKPDFADAHFNRSVALGNLQRFEEALTSCDRAILLDFNFAEAHGNRGLMLKNMKRFDEALLSFQRSIVLNFNQPLIHFSIGEVFDNLRRLDKALESYTTAISLDPNCSVFYLNRGVVLENLKRFDEAVMNYDQAILLDELPFAYYNKSFVKLILGDYEFGWQLYEWRRKSTVKEHIRKFPQALWLGETLLAAKTLLIHVEQGLGDVIQFCRYVHMAKDLGANIILEVQPSLVSLLSTLKSDITITEFGADLPPFDFQCPIASLPLAFKTTLESIPADVPYLFCNPDKQKLWKERLGVKTKKRIGLVCSGSTILTNDAQRSIPLHLFKLLLELPFEFHLLQKEIRPDDEVFLAENSHIQTHHKDLTDFSDTAAVIAEIDLVISVDTSVAHLAGALGKPVWILLPWKPDWRWLLDRTDSPWYPTATLFRQREIGNWESVIEDVCQKLMTHE